MKTKDIKIGERYGVRSFRSSAYEDEAEVLGIEPDAHKGRTIKIRYSTGLEAHVPPALVVRPWADVVETQRQVQEARDAEIAAEKQAQDQIVSILGPQWADSDGVVYRGPAVYPDGSYSVGRLTIYGARALAGLVKAAYLAGQESR